LVGNKFEADDLTSETFLRAWNAIDRFEDRGFTIEVWLLKIGRNLTISYLKRRGRESTNGEMELQVDPKLSPEQQAEALLDNEAVRQALSGLPTIQQKVLTLRFFDGLSYLQVAAIVGKSQGTVRVIQHRALRSLRQLLMKSGLLTQVVRTSARSSQVVSSPVARGGGK
jgi:RNA polymerase sigma-70 factor (ECF subfamily)